MPATLTLCDGTQVRLGHIRPKALGDAGRFRLRVAHDGTHQIIPKLENYVDLAVLDSAVPATLDWSAKAMDSIKRVYLNDQYGDCVIASKYHMEGVASANELGSTVLASDQEVLSSYHKICGPGDNGCDIPTVLDAWKNDGLPFNGTTKKIDGWVAIDWTNKALVKAALAIFSTICLGINLPSGWTCTNCIWGKSGGNVGGHDVPAFGYSDGDQQFLKDATGKSFGSDGVLIATWGGLVCIPWAEFLSKSWIEEAYVALPQDWYAKGGVAPSGVNVATLQSDLQMLSGGQIPPDPQPAPTTIDWTP